MPMLVHNAAASSAAHPAAPVIEERARKAAARTAVASSTGYRRVQAPEWMITVLATVLGPYCENNAAMWHCPLDEKRFPSEGLSYEYQPRVAGKSLDELRNNKLGLPLMDVWLTYDFDPVHGANADTSRNYLYADAHVE